MEQDFLVEIVKEILDKACALSQEMSRRNIFPPENLQLGSSSSLWTTQDKKIDHIRSTVLSLTQKLTALLQGPHEFLHDYVSRSWEHGAFYALLEFDVLEKIPLIPGAAIPIGELASQTSLPVEKLLRICRLLATTGILLEPEQGHFAHTAISEELVNDNAYKDFIAFQLFETRAASVHLADSLRETNSFWTGKSAFELAWGMPMYDWHAQNPEKGRRFAKAMQSVSKRLDAGDDMIIDWVRALPYAARPGALKIIEVQGKTGSFSSQLACLFPNIEFEVQDSSLESINQGKESLNLELRSRVSFQHRDLFTPRKRELSSDIAASVFLLRGVLWNLDDDQVITLLQSFIAAMEHSEETRIVICDLVSPSWCTFEPYIERAYRRRDVTLMTMHNVKQRTAAEWSHLIAAASPLFTYQYTEKFTSHSCRGLWDIQVKN